MKAKTWAIEQLERFKHIKERSDLASISPDDPLFFIRYISKNEAYFNTLYDVTHNHFDEVLSFVEYLQDCRWDLHMINHIQNHYPNFRFNNGFDLAYIGYLSKLITAEFFYDYVLFQSIIQSFSGQPSNFKDNREEIVQVPPLPICDTIKKHVVSSDETGSSVMENYISSVKQALINSLQFCFSDTQFANALYATKNHCIFEVELDHHAFQTMTAIWPHNIWFELFLRSPKYALFQAKINHRTNKISLFIPGDALLNAFTVAISPEPSSVVKPVYAFGIVKVAEEARLHGLGYHLVSIFDPRFKNLVRLHGRIGNSLESLLHDSMFHSVIASSHPQYIHRIFTKIYHQLNSITNPEYELFIASDEHNATNVQELTEIEIDSLAMKISPELLSTVLDEFKSRCIGLGRLFYRNPEDYHSHEYYFRETLKSVLIGTINQILSELPTTQLDASQTEEAIKQILIRCCAYINKTLCSHHVADSIPSISNDWVEQVFFTATEKGEIIMSPNDPIERERNAIKANISELKAQLEKQEVALKTLSESDTKNNRTRQNLHEFQHSVHRFFVNIGNALPSCTRAQEDVPYYMRRGFSCNAD